MKQALLTIFQFVLFLLAFAAGSFVAPMRLRQVLSIGPEGTHLFIWDGVLWMGLLYLAILAIYAMRHRLRAGVLWTTLAFAAALAAGLAVRLGFKTV